MAPTREYGANRELFDKVVLFPHVQCQSLWPERFVRDDILDKVKGDRLFAQDLAVLKRTQEKAEFPEDLRAFVAERSISEALFYNWGHPTGPLLAKILSGIIKQLDGIISNSDAFRLIEMIEHSGGIDNITSHPVSPQRVESIGFNWARTPAYEGWFAAVGHYRAQDFDSAVIAAQSSLEADPENGFVWGLLGQSLERSSSASEAEGAFRNATRLLPNAPSLVNALCRHLLRQRMPTRAFHVALDGMDRFPTDVTMYCLVVEAQLALGRIDDAITTVEESVRRGRSHGSTYVRMLQVLRRAGVEEPLQALYASMVNKAPHDNALKNFIL